MLKRIRILIALPVFAGFCLLFVDVSGLLPQHLAFLARLQLVPAILAGSLGTVTALLLISLCFGRIYCSTLCPLGVMQDALARLNPKRRYRFTPARTSLRLALLAGFGLAFAAGLPLVFSLMEPYSAFGRIAADILAPAWVLGSNALALAAERMDSFAIGNSPIWQKGAVALASACLTLLVIAVLAYRSGRTWCNTICPVGTTLGFLNRFALTRPRLDQDACVRCGRCERACKSGCIDGAGASLDASRCVSCFTCVSLCPQKAITYRPLWGARPALAGSTALAANPRDDSSCGKTSQIADVPHTNERSVADCGRRAFFTALLGTAALPLTVLAAEKEKDIPALTRKRPSERTVPVLPPGAGGYAAFSARCTGCQLCVSACPNQVLRASDKGKAALQPVMSFERGYCRVNCVTCSSVCPAGAIRPVTVAEKSAIQIGRAITDLDICIVTTDKVSCTACQRACPADAINLVGQEGDIKRPSVDAERCIGCGACEYICPARPLAAIRVEGNLEHRRV